MNPRRQNNLKLSPGRKSVYENSELLQQKTWEKLATKSHEKKVSETLTEPVDETASITGTFRKHESMFLYKIDKGYL